MSKDNTLLITGTAALSAGLLTGTIVPSVIGLACIVFAVL